MALTAVKALEKAAEWFDKAERAGTGGKPTDVVAIAVGMAQALSTYALAHQLWYSHVDVRTGGGI